MQVIKHVHNMYDVFVGVGYDQHSRIHFFRDREGRSPSAPEGRSQGRVLVGAPINKGTWRKLKESLDTKKHYQTIEE